MKPLDPKLLSYSSFSPEKPQHEFSLISENSVWFPRFLTSALIRWPDWLWEGTKFKWKKTSFRWNLERGSSTWSCNLVIHEQVSCWVQKMSLSFISGEEKEKKEGNGNGDLKRGKALKETGPRHGKGRESLLRGWLEWKKKAKFCFMSSLDCHDLAVDDLSKIKRLSTWPVF